MCMMNKERGQRLYVWFKCNCDDLQLLFGEAVVLKEGVLSFFSGVVSPL